MALLTEIPDQDKVCVLSPIRSVMGKYSVPICSIRVSEGMRRDWEAGLFVTFVTNSFEGCVQKAIHVYLHKGTS